MKDLDKPFWRSKGIVGALFATISALIFVYIADGKMGTDSYFALAGGIMTVWSLVLGGSRATEIAAHLPRRRGRDDR